jgi:hypothetical protein
MKKLVIIGIVAMTFVMVTFTIANAFGGIAIGERIRMYNAQITTTVKCVISEVGQVDQVWGPMKGKSYGVNLTVRTDKETLTVYLGPSWYIDRQDMKIGKNDIIEVKGCKKIFNGKYVIVAQEITKNNKVLVLRDNDGNPVWEGEKAAKINYR